MSNTAIIYRYQTLDSFQRGIYYTSLVDPLCELQDCAEYELPSWAELGENMDGIKLIYDSRGMVCDITAGKTAVTLRGSGGSVRLRRLRVIKPFPDGVIPM